MTTPGSTRRPSRFAAITALTVLLATVAFPSIAFGSAPKCGGKRATKFGTAGDDSINGTKRADVIVGMGGNDTILAGGGNDIICGNGGDDVIFGEKGSDRELGGGGADFFFGEGGNDQMIGGAGGDLMNGGPGDDLFDGGRNGDVAVFFSSQAPVRANLATGRATGEGRDRLRSIAGLSGSDFDDVLIGNAQSNTIFGGGGNDDLNGAGEIDGLGGDAGDDRIDGGSPDVADLAFYLSAEAPVNIDLATGIATGETEGSDDLVDIQGTTGTVFNDTLLGNDENNFILPGPGNDRLDGRGGTGDMVFFGLATEAVVVNLARGDATGGTAEGSEGNDTLTGFEGVLGSEFNDTLTGDDRGNVIMGEGGDDKIAGAGGDDWLVPGLGNDAVNGGPGLYDLIAFDDSGAAVNVDLQANTATGQGTDNLGELEAVAGSAFGDTIGGSSTPNFLFGEAGRDTIDGKEGNDALSGGPGADVLSGSDGTDTCGSDELDSVATCEGGEDPPPHPLFQEATVAAKIRFH